MGEQARQYLASLYALVPGTSVRINPNGSPQLLGVDGKTVKIDVLLADTARLEGWLQAISTFQAVVAQVS